MPEGATWLYGFIGEYPWAAAFNTEPESYRSRGGNEASLIERFNPVSSSIAAEWEYDASLSTNMHIPVPSRLLFGPRDLWWDGHDAFRRDDGTVALRAPAISLPGPSALIADHDDLLRRLKRIDKAFVWTLLGEKIIIGGFRSNRSARCTFSQVAMLKADGSIKFSKVTFFND